MKKYNSSEVGKSNLWRFESALKNLGLKSKIIILGFFIVVCSMEEYKLIWIYNTQVSSYILPRNHLYTELPIGIRNIFQLIIVFRQISIINNLRIFLFKLQVQIKWIF